MSDVDNLIPDPMVAREFNVSLMTLWRWDRDAQKVALGWRPKVKIGDRNFRHRSRLEAFKASLLQRALADREAASA
jgi:transposase-like protein